MMPTANLRLDPHKAGAAPWKAIYQMHGKWVSSRYWTQELATSALTAAGFQIAIED